ncbi:hypothetical protein HA402_007275 [Bradysia odoriphaga]|nr:hypothetical protein HA402_007275 [Bradysia odoriphaga]
MQLFCGGIHQNEVVGGNCGVCGDRYTDPIPRDNEIGGKYYRGIITGTYIEGGIIDIEVQLTQAHLGFMEFRLCISPLAGETQDCFNQNILQRADGQGSKTMVDYTGWYKMQYRLPAGVICNHCTLQWNYRAGNDWGPCPDGTEKRGCGPQETFRGCSDIVITPNRYEYIMVVLI